MVCTLAFERQQRATMFWTGPSPRLPMLTVSEFTSFLDDQDSIWPLENLPRDEDGFDRDLGMSIWERRDHEEEMYRKFDFTLRRLAGWLLSANAYPQRERGGGAFGVVEVWELPKLEYVPGVLKHPRIKYTILKAGVDA
ncbi:hypothetical protein DRE_04505 [Drechslerella stenobrocha 248]|uniref:Uncharacterized protein n=1 Tax=Drechslerella stenobrocha 248 TaxID=1043628 RepID=W7HST7_9PEZI|nr:hypothetical protein DRE_04505 [Drechslerella stenobrocha 248]